MAAPVDLTSLLETTLDMLHPESCIITHHYSIEASFEYLLNLRNSMQTQFLVHRIYQHENQMLIFFQRIIHLAWYLDMDRQSNLQPGLPMDGAVKDLGQEMWKNHHVDAQAGSEHQLKMESFLDMNIFPPWK